METDEIAEEEDDVIYEHEVEEETIIEDGGPVAEGVTLSAFPDAEPTREGMATRSLDIFDLNAFNMTRHHV